MKRAYGYTRSAAGETSHIQLQEMRIKDYCIKNNIILVDIFIDNGKSGLKTFQNKGMNELLSRCFKDGNINAVIAIDSDRISRNGSDYLLIKNFLKRKGIEILVTDRENIADLLSPTPRDTFVNDVIKAMREFEKEVIKKYKQRLL